MLLHYFWLCKIKELLILRYNNILRKKKKRSNEVTELNTLQWISTDHVLTQHIGLDKIENRLLMKWYIEKIIVNIAFTILYIYWDTYIESGTIFILSE